MYVIKHEWAIFFEGHNPFDIENLLIDSDVGNFNSVKIVLLKKYEDVLKSQTMNNRIFLVLFF